jgi:hypothetical protein
MPVYSAHARAHTLTVAKQGLGNALKMCASGAQGSLRSVSLRRLTSSLLVPRAERKAASAGSRLAKLAYRTLSTNSLLAYLLHNASSHPQSPNLSLQRSLSLAI